MGDWITWDFFYSDLSSWNSWEKIPNPHKQSCNFFLGLHMKWVKAPLSHFKSLLILLSFDSYFEDSLNILITKH